MARYGVPVTEPLLLAVAFYVLYWVIRTAVHHGTLDAERSRSKRQRSDVEDLQ
jgi:hypothetical protein